MNIPDISETRQRVAAHLVGRECEIELTLAAVAASRDILLEGPPGTSKTTMLKAITTEWGIPLLFVEGNADLTPAKLVGRSVRGAIDCVLRALQLALLRRLASPEDDAYPELVYDAMTVSLSGRIHLDEAAGNTPERVLREIWEDRFVLEPAIAEPG